MMPFLWVPDPWSLFFEFDHRFYVSPAPAYSVVNDPTMHLAFGLPVRTSMDVYYASNSAVVTQAAVVPNDNEWQVSLKNLLVDPEQFDFGVSAVVAYNISVRSVDAEVSIGNSTGPFHTFLVGRGYGNGFGTHRVLGDIGGGAQLDLTKFLALRGEVAHVIGKSGGPPPWTWVAGVDVAIPYSPHTFAIQATNTRSSTLQGMGYGGDQVWYGFAFTIEFGSIERWKAIFTGGEKESPEPQQPEPEPEPEPKAAPAPQPAPEQPPAVVPAPAPAPEEPPAAAPAPQPAPEAKPAPEPQQAKPAPKPEAAAPAEVHMVKSRFSPDTLQVEAGTTVRWVNDDDVPHTVTADDGSFDSGVLNPGASFTHTFDAAGTVPYHCTLHPFMKANVVAK